MIVFSLKVSRWRPWSTWKDPSDAQCHPRSSRIGSGSPSTQCKCLRQVKRLLVGYDRRFKIIRYNSLVTQEAVSTGDPELVKLILQHRDIAMVKNQAKLVTSLLDKLKEAPDFYLEIKWEFTSWCKSTFCLTPVFAVDTIESLFKLFARRITVYFYCLL